MRRSYATALAGSPSPRAPTEQLDAVRARLLNEPMSRAQWLAVAACVILNMIDGFDILAAAFTAPPISREWHLLLAQTGLFLSSGLAGMTLGALFLAPLADRLGRRSTILVALGLMSSGLFGSSLAPNFSLLLGSRLLTGLGVGAMLPTINTVAAEVANARHKDLAVCLQGAGFPIGGTLGGLAAYGILSFGWRYLFFVAALATIFFIPAILAWVPESIEFLVERQPRNMTASLNQVLERYRLPPVDPVAAPVQRPRNQALLWDRSSFSIGSLLICASFFLLMFSFYFLTSWTPELLTSYGLSAKAGISGGILVNAGGVMGDLVFALLTLKWRAQRVGPLFMLACFIAALLMGIVPLKLPFLAPLAFLVGFLLFGSILSLYATAAKLYPVASRTTGTGLALGLGRIGATLGPWVGGMIIALQWPRLSYLSLMALPILLCAALLLMLRHRLSGTNGRLTS